MRPPAPAIAAVLAAAVAALAGAACGAPERTPEGAPPNLVLVVIDTLRADHLGAYGYARPTSPRLDALAARGVVFENAFAASSWTKPSVGSLVTSRLPAEHGALALGTRISRDVPVLAERLQEAGYATVGVSGNFVHVNADSGFARGFDHWTDLSMHVRGAGEDVLWTQREAGRGALRLRAPRAEEMNAEARRLLGLRRSGAPTFLYLQYMDPHAGYDPPEPWRRRFLRDPAAAEGAPPADSDYVVDLAVARAPVPEAERRRLVDLYDAEIAYADDRIGALVDELVDGVLGPNTVVHVISDHGEELADHGGWFHGFTLYRESVRVPWIVRDFREGAAAAARRRAEVVDGLDLAPTLLAQAGLAPSPGMRGRDVLADGPLAPREDLLGDLPPDPGIEGRLRGRRHRWALVRWPWKLIVHRDGATELYDLAADPGERHDRAAEERTRLARLLRSGEALLAALPETDAGSGSLELDATALEALRRLGYVE